MSPAMIEAQRALDRYRDAVELRARFEAAHAGREVPRIKLACLKHDERDARAALEEAFRLAVEGLGSPVADPWPLCACGSPARGDLPMCTPCLHASVPR